MWTGKRSKIVTLTASGQALTGLSQFKDIKVCPAAGTTGRVVAYNGSASGAASTRVGYITCAVLSSCEGKLPSMGITEDALIEVSGGLYITLTGVTAVMVEYPG